MARWLEQLEEYDFDIVHRPGKLHGNADALSHLPCTESDISNNSVVSAVANISLLPVYSSQDIQTNSYKMILLDHF